MLKNESLFMELKEKVRVGLDENRILVRVVEVLVGFDFRAAFEPRFEKGRYSYWIYGLLFQRVQSPGARVRSKKSLDYEKRFAD